MNTKANATLLQLFAKYYIVQVWKNTPLVEHHDIMQMYLASDLKLLVLFCYDVSVMKTKSYTSTGTYSSDDHKWLTDIIVLYFFLGGGGAFNPN